MKTELIKSEDFGIDNVKANELTKGLETIIAEKEALKKQYVAIIDKEITEDLCAVARTLRFAIKDNRTKGINPWHKSNKAYFLAGGRFVDAIKNKEILENEAMEEKLMKVEMHFVNLETARLLKESIENTARLEKLQNERLNKIKEYVTDAYLMDLSAMEEDVFEAYLSTKKQAHLDYLKSKKEAEEKANAEIKAEMERLEAIEKDNAKLRKEAQENEKAAKIKEDVERKKREQLETKLKEKQDAEIKAKKEAEAAVQAELNKGDADKVKDLIADLEALKTKYTFKSSKNNKMHEDTKGLINKVVSHIEKY